ncbi:MAG: ATP-binding protein, partial [Verrucomicrobiia bacterium]
MCGDRARLRLSTAGAKRSVIGYFLMLGGGLVVVILVYLLVVHVIIPLRVISAAVRKLSEHGRLDLADMLLDSPLHSQTQRALRMVNDRIGELDRRVLEESLNLRTILDSIGEAVLILDRDLRVRLFNQGAVTFFGLGSSPLNKTILEVFRSLDVQEAAQESVALSEPVKREISLDLLREDGYRPTNFQLTAAPLIVAHDGPIGVVLAFHDVTELKKLEAVRKEFVANVSHELRTPLSIINGYVETLLEGALTNQQVARGFLQTISKHGQRLALLVDDLLTISQLETGGVRMDLIAVNFRDIASQVVEQLQPRIESRDARVCIDLPPDLPVVQADAVRVEQALFNLIDNALKYCTGSKPEILIAGRLNDEKPPAHLELSISDNGPGIPLAAQQHVFERFYRVHKDRSRDAGGTGLGLAIATASPPLGPKAFTAPSASASGEAA